MNEARIKQGIPTTNDCLCSCPPSWLTQNLLRDKPQAARNDLQELQRKKAALALELMSLEDASRNRKQGTRGAGAIPANTEASILVKRCLLLS